MSLARDITTVGSGTLMSRLLGFARDSTIAALLGAGPFSEVFFAVLQLVNFFRRLLAEGALNSAFVPIWLKLRNGEDGQANADRFARHCLLTVGCVTGIVALIVIVFSPGVAAALAPGFDGARRVLTAYLLMLIAPYIALAGLIAVMAAALNAEGRVGAVTMSTIAFNLVILIALVLMFGKDLFQGEVTLLLAGAIVVAGLIQLAITATGWLATGKRFTPVQARARSDPPVLHARVARADRQRHSAAQADRGGGDRVIVAGLGIVALLRQSALRIAARRRIDRHRLGDRAAHCREPALR